MNWYAFSVSDVLAQFNDSETAAYDTAKGDTASADLPSIVTAVIAQIQEAWTNGGRAPDPTGATATIPAGELNRAVALARWRYLLALPTGQTLQTPERKHAADDAETYLLQIAKRQVKPGGAVAVARPTHRMQNLDFLGSTGGR
jgi:hypothetical protein